MRVEPEIVECLVNFSEGIGRRLLCRCTRVRLKHDDGACCDITAAEWKHQGKCECR